VSVRPCLFFLGITLTVGLSYLGMILLKKGKFNNLLFDVLAYLSALYHLPSLFQPFEGYLTLFFAILMFVLFPWYFGYKSGFIRKKFL
jgi:hypothetical protein